MYERGLEAVPGVSPANGCAGRGSRLAEREPTPRLDNSICAELLSAVRQFHGTAQSWHRTQPATTCTGGGIAMTALQLHAMNFNLWHHEDAVRRPGAGDKEVADSKRVIDGLNARRSQAIEDIDVTVLDRLDPDPDRCAMLHTETPGMIIDRLSVLTLRISHTETATGARRAVLEEQYDDLLSGLERFLMRMQEGKVGFKLYRQFKSAAQRSYCALFEHGLNHQENDPT